MFYWSVVIDQLLLNLVIIIYYLVRFCELTYHKACVHSKLRELSCMHCVLVLRLMFDLAHVTTVHASRFTFKRLASRVVLQQLQNVAPLHSLREWRCPLSLQRWSTEPGSIDRKWLRLLLCGDKSHNTHKETRAIVWEIRRRISAAYVHINIMWTVEKVLYVYYSVHKKLYPKPKELLRIWLAYCII